MDTIDGILIFPPGASQLASAWASTIQLGSWLMADPGPDYGARGLIESVEAQNALRDGGTFAYRRGVIRKMALPLMLNTPSPAGWETALRKAVTPGAIVAVQPEGVPSAQAVYFDIIDGRWEPDYNIFHNRAGVRKGTLYLDTQPWGYWPTEILLASAASIGWMGQIPVNGASVIGDVPPLAHVIFSPTVASTYIASAGAAQRWGPDMAALSFGGRPSFNPFIPAASFLLNTRGQVGIANIPLSASLAGDKYAPGSQAVVLTVGTGPAPKLGPYNFAQYADTNLSIPSALEPAYRGRFRVFMFAKSAPSSAPWWATIDTDRFVGSGVYSSELASANPIATVYNFVPSDFGGNGYSASPAYGTFDMGEVTLPPAGSGYQQGVRLRAWFGYPSGSPTLNLSLSFAGLYLLPADGAAGLLTRGLITPTPIDAAAQGGLELNNAFVEGRVWVTIPASNMISADGLSFYRGVPLRIGASTNQLTLLTGDRQYSGAGGAQNSAAGTTIVAEANVEYAQVSVSYRPTFQFLAGG